MNTETLFIEPVDVLFLRNNKLFGDSGSYGESHMPPWPSVAAGAIRSRILADDQVNLAAFARGEVNHPTLGTPAAPGNFALTAFNLGRRFADGHVELLIALPADLIIKESGKKTTACLLRPETMLAGLETSSSLPMLPVLAEEQRSKQATGYWLRQAGWESYLRGQNPAADHLVKSSELWALDYRLGIGLDAQTRRAADGKLFTTQAVSMVQRQNSAGFDVGFVATVSGAKLPKHGSLRLGGDGRAAALHHCEARLPCVEYKTITTARRCRIVLTSPGIFANGWLLPGLDTAGNFKLAGIRGKLVCATVPRAETISGWDIARKQPKDAQRVAPTGSVYWLDELETTPEALGKLVESGLWADSCEDATRRAEGYNRFAFAAY